MVDVRFLCGPHWVDELRRPVTSGRATLYCCTGRAPGFSKSYHRLLSLVT